RHHWFRSRSLVSRLFVLQSATDSEEETGGRFRILIVDWRSSIVDRRRDERLDIDDRRSTLADRRSTLADRRSTSLLREFPRQLHPLSVRRQLLVRAPVRLGFGRVAGLFQSNRQIEVR